MTNGRRMSNWPLNGYGVAVFDNDGDYLDGDIQAVTLVNSAGSPIPMGSSVSSVNESSVNVTTSSQVLVAANADRIGGYIQNVSDTTINYSYTGTAATTGLKLFPNQSLPFQFGYNGAVYTGAMSFIHGGTGSKALMIVEVE